MAKRKKMKWNERMSRIQNNSLLGFRILFRIETKKDRGVCVSFLYLFFSVVTTIHHKFMSKKKMNEWINLHRENSWCISINLISHRSLFFCHWFCCCFFISGNTYFLFGRKKLFKHYFLLLVFSFKWKKEVIQLNSSCFWFWFFHSFIHSTHINVSGCCDTSVSFFFSSSSFWNISKFFFVSFYTILQCKLFGNICRGLDWNNFIPEKNKQTNKLRTWIRKKVYLDSFDDILNVFPGWLVWLVGWLNQNFFLYSHFHLRLLFTH